MWLSGERASPCFSYELVSPDPIVLTDDVSWIAADGAEKHLRGVDHWRGDGFVWRGNRLLTLLRSRWTVCGANGDGTIAAIRFSRSLVTPAGIDIIVREDVALDDPRALVASSTDRFGLTAEDFASLAWLTPAATR